jgi:predicted dehydrogenase
MAQIGVGMLGYAFMGKAHSNAFRKISYITWPPPLEPLLIGIAGRNEQAVGEAALRYGWDYATTDWRDLVADERIGLFDNGGPNSLHAEPTIAAAVAGKHVLCEKPLACSSAEVEQMFAAAHSNKRCLMEGFMHRFHPQMAEARRVVTAGEIGRILYIRSHRTAQGRGRDNPRYWRDAGGGALMDIGCYCVNLSRFFADAEPKRVEANAHFDEPTGVDLTLSGSLHFDQGVSAHFVCSMEAEASYPAEIIGTSGKLLIPHPWVPQTWPAELYLTRNGKTEVIRVDAAHAPEHVLAPYALELNHFFQCVRENRAPQFPPDLDAESDSRGNMRAIEALLESARQGRPVTAPA